MATPITRYVNTASVGGDGTTNNITGATAAYASLNAAEVAERAARGDLVAADETLTIKCCGTIADTTGVSFVTGWTLDATRFITIEGNSGHSAGVNNIGVYSSLFYRLETTSGYSLTSRPNLVVENIQLKTTNGTGALLSHSFARKLTISVNGTATYGIIAPTVGSEISNCVLSGVGSGSGIYMINDSHLVYNNSIEGFSKGLDYATGATSDLAKNNCIFNCTDDIFWASSAPTIDYNATDDLDGTNTVDMGGSASAWDAIVNNYSSDDYRPIEGSSLLAAGLGSATDSNVPLTDILGVIRDVNNPTIGAFEDLFIPIPFAPSMNIF